MTSDDGLDIPHADSPHAEESAVVPAASALAIPVTIRSADDVTGDVLPSLATVDDASGGPTDRDLQRAALRDLVNLANDCAAAEAQMTAHRDEAKTAAEMQIQKTQAELSERARAMRDQIDAKHVDRAADARMKFEAEARGLKDTDHSARSRYVAEHESSEAELKHKLEQAVWLAESMFEATQLQVRKDSGKADDEYRTVKEQLAAADDRGTELLALYHVSFPKGGVDEVAEGGAPVAPDKADEALKAHQAEIKSLVEKLSKLLVPRMFVGARPYLIVIGVLLAAMIAAQVVSGPQIATAADLKSLQPQWRSIAYAAGSAAGVLLVFGLALWFLGRAQVRQLHLKLQTSLADARRAARVKSKEAQRIEDAKYAAALRSRDIEVKALKDRAAPQLARVNRTRDELFTAADSERKQKMSELEILRSAAVIELDQWRAGAQSDLQKKYDDSLFTAQQRHDEKIAVAEKMFDDAWTALQKRWQDGLTRIRSSEAQIDPQATLSKSRSGSREAIDGIAPRRWDDPAWSQWKPPTRFSSVVPFGRLRIDIKQITSSVPNSQSTKLELPPSFSLPAMLAFPSQASLLVQADRDGRDAALQTLQMVMTRLLTTQPAGRVRFTIIDPIGLGQNFAGFMHLADHDESLVGGRIWTSPEQIEQRLSDLTEHMETIIQKYLRNEFATIDDYNAQAGELAEPYRFLVIADFPISFSQEAIQRLNSIASTGSRCGVYTLIARDLRTSLPPNTHIDEVESHSVNLSLEKGALKWKDEVFEQFPLALDSPADENSLTKILNVVGHHAKDANRVEVSFETIAPDASQFWSGDCSSELRVPVGRMGATRSQLVKLGRGVAQHALIAGKTGSGKSTLLHALVTNLAMWYHPDQVEFYLVDFKKGVEFKTYADHLLPHARAIAVESDREFGLSVLQRLDAELTYRGELYRKLGVQDLAGYRAAVAPSASADDRSAVPENFPRRMPRTLLIIDEFQEFFSEDDKLAQDAALLMDRLVRQGRAFGIHVVLGSQTIGGSGGLSRSTIGQMAVRVALQTSEADSQLILGDNNSAARLLSRPGEAIYNDQGGLVEANSPFQVAWLPDDRREEYLLEVQKRARDEQVQVPEANVFEGNAAADVRKNRPLMALLTSKTRVAPSGSAPLAWLGEPVAIKDPTAIAFRRQSGTNVLIVGQNEEQGLSILLSSLISLSLQDPNNGALFYVLDGSPADSHLAGTFDKLTAIVGPRVKVIEWRGTDDAINTIHEEMTRRQAAGDAGLLPPIFLFIYGLQRYRSLRKQEENFSFSSSDEEKKASPDKQFSDLLREGPPLGVHIIAWADTPSAVERTLDRIAMREFDHRILFQMSANDSSNLIDSPAANKLGFHRALAYSEEHGVIEKFRPYSLPTESFLAEVKARIGS